MGRHYERGIALYELRRTQDAIAEFTAELEANPRSLEAFGMRALCHLQLGRLVECEADLGEAIALDPEWSYSCYLMSIVDLTLGRWERADEHIHEALRLRSSSAYYAQLAAVEAAGERFEASLEASRVALEIDPNNIDCRLLRARVLNKLNRPEEARALLLATLALEPESAETHQELGSLNFERGAAEQAFEHWIEARRPRPNQFNFWWRLVDPYGRSSWFYRQVDQFRSWIWHADWTQQRLVVNLVFTLLIVTLLATRPDIDHGRFSWVAAAIFGGAANGLLLLATCGTWTRLASLIKLRGQLDLKPGDYGLAGLELVFLLLIPHSIVAFLAGGITGVPAFVYFVMALVILCWDWYGLIRDFHLLITVLLVPVMGIASFFFVLLGAIWMPRYWETILLHWSVVLVISFACRWARHWYAARTGSRGISPQPFVAGN